MEMLTPTEIVRAYAKSGEKKAAMSAGRTFLLAILAGFFIAMGCAATSTAVYALDNASVARTVTGLLFPIGLVMVVILGAELFTGNNLMLISVAEKRIALPAMLRNWGIVYLGNWMGALLAAVGCAFFGQLDQSGGKLAVYAIKLAAGKCAIPFANGVVLGVLANVLVCAGVLLSLSARDVAGKILGAYLPVVFFVVCGFEHSVANMYYIEAGLLAASRPDYLQMAVAAGVNVSTLTPKLFLLGNLLPVTIGNIIGGGGLGLLLWASHIRNREHPAL